ncbi:MAG: PepSY-like domain-containing protein [Chitinophagaceae bacterium]
MRKILMPALAITVIAFSACAQKIDASKVPDAVKASFTKQFPGVTAKWEKENGKYEAEFKQKGNSMSAVFEANGNMDETEIEIKASDLPAAVLTYIKEHYKGKIIKEAAKINHTDGTVNYEAEVDGKDIIFDVAGNFIKEAND